MVEYVWEERVGWWWGEGGCYTWMDEGNVLVQVLTGGR